MAKERSIGIGAGGGLTKSLFTSSTIALDLYLYRLALIFCVSHTSILVSRYIFNC